MRVLIVDSDSVMLDLVARSLREGFSIDVCTNKAGALDLLRANDFHVVVACERLEDGSGLDLLSQAAKRWPETLRIFAAEPDRLALLRGRLGPFKLFQTMGYPIEPGPLGSILMLAQAADAADADTMNVQHIVLGDERAAQTDVPTPVVAQAAAAAAPVAAPPTARLGHLAASMMPNPSPRAAPPPPAKDPARRKPLTREAIAHAHRALRAMIRPAAPAPRPAAAAPPRPAAPAPQAPPAPQARPTVAAAAHAPQVARPAPAPAPPPRHAAPSQPRPQPVAASRPASMPPTAPAPRRDPTGTYAVLKQDAARLQPMPSGFQAYRTQILIAAAALAVVIGIGLGVTLSSGGDADEAQVAASAADARVEAIVNELEAALTADDNRRARAALQKLRRASPKHPRLPFFNAIVKRRDARPATRTADTTRREPSSWRSEEAAFVSPGEAAQRTDARADPILASAAGSADDPDAASSSTTDASLLEPLPGPEGAADVAGVVAAAPGTALPVEGAPVAPPPTSTPQGSAEPDPRAADAPSRPDDAESKAFTARTLEQAGIVMAPESQAAYFPPVVREAKLVKRAAPEYPEGAQRDGKEGAVDVAFTVTTDGRVTNPEVVGADPPGIFDRAALAAVRRWRYEPRMEDGRTVEWRTQVRIEFKLQQ